MSEQTDAVNKVLRAAGVAPPEIPIEAAADEQAGLPGIALTIELTRDGRGPAAFAREAGSIARTNGVFRREVVPVTIDRETGGMIAMTAARFQTYLADLALIYKRKLKVSPDGEQTWSKVEGTMKIDLARSCLAADQFVYQQRRLSRINTVRQPVLRRDGRIELLPVGYDEESEIFTMKNDVIIDETWDLEKARTFLVDMHKEFPFEDRAASGLSRGLAVHIASMLALFGFSLQDLTEPRMNFVYTANSQGAGKGLLTRIAVVPTIGTLAAQTIPDSKEEFRKVLDAAAVGAEPYLFFDEVEGNVKNATLNAFMTSDFWKGRLMGSLVSFTCPKQTICFLTGNNLSLSPDVARRTLMSTLYVEESDVQERVIEHVLSTKTLASSAKRSDILSALWALVRAWNAAGRPKCSRTLGGFEAWCDIFGGIVENAGFGAPTAAPPEDQSGDTETDDMRLLVKHLAVPLSQPGANGQPPHKVEYTFDELIEACRSLNCFTWMIEGKERVEKIEGRESSRWFEVTGRTASTMGKLFSGKFGGRLFPVRGEDGVTRRVQFGSRGRNRQKRYEVKLVVPTPAA